MILPHLQEFEYWLKRNPKILDSLLSFQSRQDVLVPILMEESTVDLQPPPTTGGLQPLTPPPQPTTSGGLQPLTLPIEPTAAEEATHQLSPEPLLPIASEPELDDDLPEEPEEGQGDSSDRQQDEGLKAESCEVVQQTSQEAMETEVSVLSTSPLEEVDGGGSIMVGEEASEIVPQLPELMEVARVGSEVPTSPVLPTTMETIVTLEEVGEEEEEEEDEEKEEKKEEEEVQKDIVEDTEEGSTSESSEQEPLERLTMAPLVDMTIALTPQASVESEGDAGEDPGVKNTEDTHSDSTSAGNNWLLHRSCDC